MPFSCCRKHWINPPVPEAWSPLKQTVVKQSWNESCDAGKWPLTRTVAVSAGLPRSPLPLPALSDSWSFTFFSRQLPLQPLWRTSPSTVTPFPVSPVAFHPIFSRRCFCQDFLHTQTHSDSSFQPGAQMFLLEPTVKILLKIMLAREMRLRTGDLD